MTETTQRLSAALTERYRIERPLGEGGMATVYLAEDVKHDRKVAVKVLRPELAAVLGAERFVVEIKTTAALQHPHILPLFDSGTADGFLYYVMPYIQGETLRDKLNRETQLGIEEAVKITSDVADALDYAHRQGVIHRDIKPENILLHDGRPMVADFGIALAVSAAAGGRMTETGLSLGTPHYMSPEQATAEKEITARSDVYSLGSVLYEMLAGEPPHLGGSAQQIIMKIIAEEAQPVTQLRKSVPPHVAAAVGKALEKLPADRFGSAKAFADALHDRSFTVSGTRVVAGGQAVAARPWKWLSMALAAAVVFLLGVAVLGRREPSPPGSVTRASIDIGDVTVQVSGNLLVSPDGSRFALAGTNGGPIYWRPADEGEFRPIPGTENAEFAAFSPNGESLVFGLNTGPTLKRIALSGGAPQTVTVMGRSVGGLDWGADGTLVYAASGGQGLFRVPAAGGDPESVLADEVEVRNPRMLPGGTQVLFTGVTGGNASTQIVDLASGNVRLVRAGALNATYVEPGYLVYADASGTLWAARFDSRKGKIVGEPVTVLDGVYVFGFYSHFAVSQTGTLVFGTGRSRASNERTLAFVTFDGATQAIPLSPRPLFDLRLAPDGRTLAYQSSAASSAGSRGPFIYTYDVILGATPRQQTVEGLAFYPVWSPDGSRLAFTTVDVAEGRASLVVKDLASAAPDRIVLTGVGTIEASDWPSKDTLVVERGDTAAIWILDLSSDTVAAREYLASEQSLRAARVSPAHDLAVYRSSGAIWVRSFPVAGPPTRISAGQGVEPRWAPDGRTIYYWIPPDERNAGSTVTLVGARLRRGPPLAVTRIDSIYQTTAFRGWELHPDGNRFVLMRPVIHSAAAGGGNRERFVVVTNLLGELRGHTP